MTKSPGGGRKAVSAPGDLGGRRDGRARGLGREGAREWQRPAGPHASSSRSGPLDASQKGGQGNWVGMVRRYSRCVKGPQRFADLWAEVAKGTREF